MPVLEIITIGTELLLGEITDSNSTYIARTLRDLGIDIYRITTIGDNPKRITAAIKEALLRSDIIITTGGLGPTIDDPTRQAVAEATDRDLVYSDELWDQIIDRFKAYGRQPTKNNQRQAFIPQGAIPISNPVGTAPCFIVELETGCVISLPGVPLEMEHILHDTIIPYLKRKFHLKSQTIKAITLHVASMGESLVDELIADLENNANPSVGLLAHPGQVDIRVTAKARSENEAHQLIKPIVDEIKVRLGENIYGQNADTLEVAIESLLTEKGLKISVLVNGMDGLFSELSLNIQPQRFNVVSSTTSPIDIKSLQAETKRLFMDQQCDFVIGLALISNTNTVLYAVYQDQNQVETKTMQFGGHMKNAPLWAKNIGLDWIRRYLFQFTGELRTGVT